MVAEEGQFCVRRKRISSEVAECAECRLFGRAAQKAGCSTQRPKVDRVAELAGRRRSSFRAGCKAIWGATRCVGVVAVMHRLSY